MKPYYEHGGIVIYHGDCREILQQFSAGIVVTDPPYGISLSNHAAGRERREESYLVNGDHSSEVGEFIANFCDERWVPLVIFASPWKPWPGTWRNLIAWDKGGAVGGGGDTSSCLKRSWELVQTARTDLYGGRDESVLRFPITPRDTEIHICRKPPELMAYLIGKFAARYDTIIDPCVGSGATLEAAKKCGHPAIGIEIEEKYCEIAAKRLSQEVFDFSVSEGTSGS